MIIITNKDNNKTKMEKEYNELYCDLPSEQNELIKFIKNKVKIDYEKYNKLNNHISSLKWNELKLEIYLEPYATPRARLNSRTNTFYVKGAAEHKKIMENMISKFNIICTTTEILIKTYQKTPKSIKPHELLLAEEGKIRPHDKDWDNLGKTYSDMIQGVLLLNDNLIVDGRTQKFYSIKPRVEVYIRYLSDFDSEFNMQKIMKSKLFVNLPDNIKISSNLIRKVK